jgi:hypothetical protein
MKKITRFCILITLLITCQLFSQVPYTPFPKKVGRWVIKTDGPQENAFRKWAFTLYETDGDTIIAGTTFMKVKASELLENISPGPLDVWTLPYGPLHLSFAYRNDIPNKKVYILADSTETINGKLVKEYLWYDFNLSVGDTLKKSFAITFPSSERSIVSGQDSILICGGSARRFHFECGGQWDSSYDDLIEGIGFNDNFLKTHYECYFEPYYLYTTYFTCSPLYTESQLKNELAVTVFPNPVSQMLQLKWSGAEQQKSVACYIVDCLGKIILEKNNADNLIDISFLSNGMYLIVLKDKEGNSYQRKFIKQE